MTIKKAKTERKKRKWYVMFGVFKSREQARKFSKLPYIDGQVVADLDLKVKK